MRPWSRCASVPSPSIIIVPWDWLKRPEPSWTIFFREGSALKSRERSMKKTGKLRRWKIWKLRRQEGPTIKGYTRGWHMRSIMSNQFPWSSCESLVSHEPVVGILMFEASSSARWWLFQVDKEGLLYSSLKSSIFPDQHYANSHPQRSVPSPLL